MSFTSEYELKYATIKSVVSNLSETKELFFDFIIKSINPSANDIWDADITDEIIFEALIESIEAKPFERFIKIRQAGESNKEINKRYISYLNERMSHSQIVKAVELL